MTTRQGDGTTCGYRKPTRPAAVSAPQSGARTDGGPGDKQPIRTPTGGAYGEASALTEQQQGAPLAAGGPGPQGQGEAPAAPPMPQDTPDLFRPTERPAEPMPQPSAESLPEADMVLRQMVQMHPSPYLLRILRNHAATR